MVVGEFTVSNISMEEDKREEEKNKQASTLDLEKFKADVNAAAALAKGNLDGSLDALLTLEKTARMAEDITACKASCSAIVTVCYEAKQWKLLEENVVLLSKRRGQLKQVIQAFVRQAMGYIEQTPDKDTKISLIKTLQTVTEGKIFVEIERARLTRKLAAIREAEGNINEAADTLQEVAVETFGAMAKTEKIAFILEQVRLCLAKKDYIRAQILARKISPRAFQLKRGEAKGEIGIEGTAIEAADEGIPSLPELKQRYYQMMVTYHLHYNNYLEVTRSFKSMYEDEEVQADPARWMPILQKICWYAALSPTYNTAEGSSSDVATLVSTTLGDKKLSELPLYRQLLTTFTNTEIVRWGLFEAQFGAEMAAQPEVFAGELGPKHLEDLKLRVVEHNVLVLSKYYTRITTKRLAQLLDLTPEKAEKALADLVVAKAVSAKVDRPAGVIVMAQRQQPEGVLNAWSANIGKLLELVEKASQQIQKEAMVHGVVLPGGSMVGA